MCINEKNLRRAEGRNFPWKHIWKNQIKNIRITERRVILRTLKSRLEARASRTSYLRETKSLTCFQWSLLVPWINWAISVGSSILRISFFWSKAKPQSGSALNWRLASSSRLKIIAYFKLWYIYVVKIPISEKSPPQKKTRRRKFQDFQKSSIPGYPRKTHPRATSDVHFLKSASVCYQLSSEHYLDKFR